MTEIRSSRAAVFQPDNAYGFFFMSAVLRGRDSGIAAALSQRCETKVSPNGRRRKLQTPPEIMADAINLVENDRGWVARKHTTSQIWSKNL